MKLFNGRINRYSWFLSQVITSLIYGIYQDNLFGYKNIFEIIGIFAILFAIVTTTKRFHDMNKSSWWILILFVPLLNIYWGFKLLFGAGDFGDNRFGPQPLKGAKLL
jgi:uncharacterized membrane protein YhaH (DUF805 family)